MSPHDWGCYFATRHTINLTPCTRSRRNLPTCQDLIRRVFILRSSARRLQAIDLGRARASFLGKMSQGAPLGGKGLTGSPRWGFLFSAVEINMRVLKLLLTWSSGGRQPVRLLLVKQPRTWFSNTTEQNPDYDGTDLSLKLHGDGNLGTFEGALGMEFDWISSAIQGSNDTVFVSSASGTKIAGKISRRVSLVHYPEPSELRERQELKMANSRKKSQISSSMALTHSSQKTPSRGARTTTTAPPTDSKLQRSSRPINGEAGEPSSNLPNKRQRHTSPGRSHSGATSSGQGRSTTTTTSGEMSSKRLK